MKAVQETYDSIEDQYLKITKEYLELTDANMEEALQRHTSIYAFFGAVLAYAKRKMDSTEIKCEYAEAKVKEDRRGVLIQAGSKVTESSLNTYVKTDTTIRELQSQVLEAQHKYNLVKNIITSMDHQKDMLVQMSANKRAELKMVSDLG